MSHLPGLEGYWANEEDNDSITQLSGFFDFTRNTLNRFVGHTSGVITGSRHWPQQGELDTNIDSCLLHQNYESSLCGGISSASTHRPPQDVDDHTDDQLQSCRNCDTVRCERVLEDPSTDVVDIIPNDTTITVNNSQVTSEIINESTSLPISCSSNTFSMICFICLEEGSLTAPLNTRKRLEYCCTQCYAVVHTKCWSQWRKNQRFATIRARLLAYNQPDPYACSICKTGIATVINEDASCMQWVTNAPLLQRLQNDLFSVIGRMLNENSDDEEEPSICTYWSFCLAICAICVITAIGIHLILLSNIYPGDIVVVSFLLCYHTILIQLAGLAIIQRWRALGVLRDNPRDAVSDTSSVDINATSIRDVELSAVC